VRAVPTMTMSSCSAPDDPNVWEWTMSDAFRCIVDNDTNGTGGMAAGGMIVDSFVTGSILGWCRSQGRTRSAAMNARELSRREVSPLARPQVTICW
jgi:hypothetical protein